MKAQNKQKTEEKLETVRFWLKKLLTAKILWTSKFGSITDFLKKKNGGDESEKGIRGEEDGKKRTG